MNQSFIQHTDFSTEDIEILDFASAKTALEEFNWAAESSKIAQAIQQDDDFCPPGMGLFRGENQFHVFMSEPNKYSVMITIPTEPKKKKLFSFLSSNSNQPISYENLSIQQIRSLLELFYQDNFDQIRNFS